MVFPDSDYNNSALTFADNEYKYTHSAFGADQFRYSMDFGQTWTNWTEWEDLTSVNTSFFAGSDMFWDGVHVMIQCTYFLLSCRRTTKGDLSSLFNC